MNVKNINVENSIFTSTTGADLRESDGVKFNNVIINAKSGPMIKLYNTKNVTLNKVSSTKAEADILKVDGKTTSNVILQNTGFKKENVQSSVSDGVLIFK